MSLTTYDSLKLNDIAPNRVVTSNEGHTLVASSVSVSPYGDLTVDKDLEAQDIRVAGDISMPAGLTVDGNLSVEQDLQIDALAGSGRRTVGIDSTGALIPRRPEAQQIFAHYAPTAYVPSGSSPFDILPAGSLELGSLMIPESWWDNFKRLSLTVLIGWSKQAGVGSNFRLKVTLVPETGDPLLLASVPVSLAVNEGLEDTFGAGVLELDMVVGGGAGCGGFVLDLLASHRFNNRLRGTFHEVLYADQDWSIKVQAEFENMDGSNAVTVRSASLVAYEDPPYEPVLEE